MPSLVTGATGLLGNNLVRQLLAEGETVRVLARGGPDRPALRGLDIDFREGDIRDPDAVSAAAAGADAILHCAGFVKIGWREQEMHEAINVQGTAHVAAAAHAEKIRLVHVSTVNALGLSTADQPADEEDYDPDIPPVPYVTSKRAGDERVLRRFDEGLDAVIVHPAFMLGPWDWKPSSGEMLVQLARRFSPVAPTGSFSLCDARDVADGVLRALRRGQSGRRYVLAGHNMTYREAWSRMAEACGRRPPWWPIGPLLRVAGGWGGDLIAKATGREPVINSAAIALGRLHHQFSSARAERELGYSIRPTEETIRDALQWFREHDMI